jgi:hypothetical protein
LPFSFYLLRYIAGYASAGGGYTSGGGGGSGRGSGDDTDRGSGGGVGGGAGADGVMATYKLLVSKEAARLTEDKAPKVGRCKFNSVDP